MPAELCIEITQDEFPVDLGINADETLWVGSGQITGIRRKTRGGAIDKGIPFVKQDQPMAGLSPKIHISPPG